jgi:hypothetical protein
MSPWESNYKSLQGNVGLGMAIAYYTNIGFHVLIPLNDTQKYDLVFDDGNKLNRVSVKTTKAKNKNRRFFEVQLKNTGGSSGRSKIRNFDNNSCDFVFVLTSDYTMYQIPSNKIASHTSIVLTTDYDKYIVNIDNGTSAVLETKHVE